LRLTAAVLAADTGSTTKPLSPSGTCACSRSGFSVTTPCPFYSRRSHPRAAMIPNWS